MSHICDRFHLASLARHMSRLETTQSMATNGLSVRCVAITMPRDVHTHAMRLYVRMDKWNVPMKLSYMPHLDSIPEGAENEGREDVDPDAAESDVNRESVVEEVEVRPITLCKGTRGIVYAIRRARIKDARYQVPKPLGTFDL